MNARTGWTRVATILAVGAIGLAFTVKISAQVQETKHETSGAPTQEVKVEKAEVILVQGNDLVLKMEDGTIRHIANVPESATATVDGRTVHIQDLKPGMHLQRTVTTTTTPKVITTVRTVTGTVWHVNPPTSVILTLEDGRNQQFKIPNGQKFMVNGQETDAWGLRKGMKVSGSRIVEEPITEVEQQAKITGHMPPPPPAPAAGVPIFVATSEPTPAPVQEVAAATLPKTGSALPLFALLGLLSMAGSVGLKALGKVRG